jgi:hypothetical protein
MKLSKLIFPIATALSVVFTCDVASALNVSNGKYVFHATDGNTYLDGSSVTFFNDLLASWNLVDSRPLPSYYPSTYLPYVPPLTPVNSSYFNLTTYAHGTGPNAFSFSVASPVGMTTTSGSVFWFSGQNNLNGFSALYDGFGGGTPPFDDPIGAWTLDISLDIPGVGVPDTFGTILLLAGALIGLRTFKSFAYMSSGKA